MWLAVLPAPALGDEGSPAAPTAAYQALLDAYLRVDRQPPALESRLAYDALLRAGGHAEVRRLLAAYGALDWQALSAPRRTAHAIDAYNVLIIDIVLEAMADGAMPDSILDIGDGDGAAFRAARWRVGSDRFSPDRWERSQVFLDHDRRAGPPPSDLDPRAHFALNCASLGCPTLWPVAFAGVAMDSLLDEATRNALANPRHLQIDRQAGRLRGSPLFKWYAHDFGGPAGVFAFVMRYAPDSTVRWATEHGVTEVVPDLEWDWQLNAAD